MPHTATVLELPCAHAPTTRPGMQGETSIEQMQAGLSPRSVVKNEATAAKTRRPARQSVLSGAKSARTRVPCVLLSRVPWPVGAASLFSGPLSAIGGAPELLHFSGGEGPGLAHRKSGVGETVESASM
jgi:hypothetical protein